jgi:uncharacterized membrane protein YdbT with pleckstrin-like domain
VTGAVTGAGEVLLDVRPHGRALVRPVAVLLPTLAVAGFAAARVPAGPSGATLRLAVVVAALVVLVPLTVVPFLRWRCTRLVLTRDRLSLRRGVLHRSTRSVPLAAVQAVTVQQTVGQRAAGAGTLVVATAEGVALVARGVPRLREVHEAVTSAVARAAGPAQRSSASTVTAATTSPSAAAAATSSSWVQTKRR